MLMLQRPCAGALAGLLSLAGCGAGGAGLPDAPPEPYPRPRYERLSETGLYSDPETLELSRGIVAFEPSYPLWSDGAEKLRYIWLPRGSSIDNNDPNRWTFPIGTRVWKEFSLDGMRLETRLIERYGEGREDFWFGAFVWNQDQTDASFVLNGQEDLLGTDHDAPSETQCWSCHNGEPGRLLGFSALQLARNARSREELTLATLADDGRLSTPAERVDFSPPGDQAARAALGYLHANCGHCHNSQGTSWPDTQMVLRLNVDEESVEGSALYQSLVGKEVQYFRDGATKYRVVPGKPDQSAILVRMLLREPMLQMPPLATELVDENGTGVVSQWISTLRE